MTVKFLIFETFKTGPNGESQKKIRSCRPKKEPRVIKGKEEGILVTMQGNGHVNTIGLQRKGKKGRNYHRRAKKSQGESWRRRSAGVQKKNFRQDREGLKGIASCRPLTDQRVAVSRGGGRKVLEDESRKRFPGRSEAKNYNGWGESNHKGRKNLLSWGHGFKGKGGTNSLNPERAP